MVFTRSKNDVFELLDHATPDLNAFFQNAQLVTVDEHPSGEDIFLLEITPALADQLLSTNTESVGEIKSAEEGSREQPAFFCSSENTHRLLETETSNSLLLLPNLKLPGKNPDKFWTVSEQTVTPTRVAAIKSVYLETSAVRAPSLKKLKHMLLPSTFAGHIEDEDQHTTASSQFYTYARLQELVPCSEHELLCALDRLNVFSWKGHCRLFQLDYLNNVSFAWLTHLFSKDKTVTFVTVTSFSLSCVDYSGHF